MAEQPRILAFAGSTRRESLNKRLVAISAHAAESSGADVTQVDLRDYPMPLFDQDYEAKNGPPGEAVKFKTLMASHDGFLLSCPEYNSSFTAVLKNTIDWVSRPSEGEEPFALSAFRGKVITLMSASPGGLGGLRGLVHARAVLGSLGAIVLPEQVAVASAMTAFADDGSLKDKKMQESIEGLGRGLAEFLKRLSN